MRTRVKTIQERITPGVALMHKANTSGLIISLRILRKVEDGTDLRQGDLRDLALLFLELCVGGVHDRTLAIQTNCMRFGSRGGSSHASFVSLALSGRHNSPASLLLLV